MNIVDLKNRTEIAAHQNQTTVSLTTLQGFELAQRAAKLLASSTIVPERYRGNLADCVVALNMAQRMGSDPLMTMQHLYVVHGTPAWSAQMMISGWNQCGRYTSIRYQFRGEQGQDNWGCRAVSTERETGNVIEGTLVTIGMAKAAGWYGKNGSKWQTMPEQMLRYRAAAWLVRANAPELGMGFQTVEEVHDVYDATPGRDGSFSVSDLRKETDDSGLSAAFAAVDAEDRDQAGTRPGPGPDRGQDRHQGGPGQDRAQARGQDRAQDRAQDRGQDPAQDRAQDRGQDPAQDRGQDRHQGGPGQDRAQDRGQDRGQDRHQGGPDQDRGQDRHQGGPDQDRAQGKELVSWPQKIDGGWKDSRGVVFDGRVHGMSGKAPAVTKAGVFTKRRGCSDQLHAQIEQESLEAMRQAGAVEPPETEAPETEATCFSPSDIALAIRRCTSIDHCNDVEDMLRDLDADQETLLNLEQALSERRERIADIGVGA